MKDEYKGYIEIILFSLFSGLIGVLVKLVRGMEAYGVLWSRAVIVVLSLGFFMLLTRRTKELRLQLPARTALVGIFQGVSVLLYFLALEKTSVSNAVFLTYSAPVFSVLLSWIFLKEQIQQKTIMGVAFSMIGIFLLFDPSTISLNSAQTLGNIFALGAGFLYAAMVVAAKPVMKRVSGMNMVFWQYLVISILFLPFIRPTIGMQIVQNGLQLLTIGIICTAVAFTLFMEGVKRVPAQKVFILASLEPVVGTIAGLMILGEIPSSFTIIGALLVLVGIGIVTRK